MASAIIETPIRFLCERRDFKFSQIGNFLKLPIRCLCFSKLYGCQHLVLLLRNVFPRAVRQTLDMIRANPSARPSKVRKNFEAEVKLRLKIIQSGKLEN